MCHSQPLFLCFRLFYCSISWKILGDDWIRTSDLGCREQPLYQLSHNHCPRVKWLKSNRKWRHFLHSRSSNGSFQIKGGPKWIRFLINLVLKKRLGEILVVVLPSKTEFKTMRQFISSFSILNAVEAIFSNYREWLILIFDVLIFKMIRSSFFVGPLSVLLKI